MVDNIKRGMLSGQQMMANKQPNWRDSGFKGVVDATANAIGASLDFNEREKQLVWSRLNLEADSLQTQQMDAIAKAQSIDEIPTIVADFQKQVKDNMAGQKYGKEWLESLGAKYFSANNGDVNKAIAAKEKELYGIQLDETLQKYADTIAKSDDDKAEALTKQAEAEIQRMSTGVLTPEQIYNTKKNLKSYITTKKNDVIRAQKQAIEQQKLQNNESITDLYTDYMSGGLTEEKLATAAKNGVFKYAPDKYAKLVGLLQKKEKTLEIDDAETLQNVKDNWADITEENLQSLQREGKLTEKTYKLYSAMKAKTAEKKGKKSTGYTSEDKAAFGQALMDRARAGEDVTQAVQDDIIAGKIDKTVGDMILKAQKKTETASEAFKQTMTKIADLEIEEDAEITELEGLTDDEKKQAKAYLKEVQGREKNKKDKAEKVEKERLQTSFDQTSDGIREGLYTTVEDLEKDPDWPNYSQKQKETLTSGLKTKIETDAKQALYKGKNLILSNNIADIEQLTEYASENGLDDQKTQELYNYMAKLGDDKYNVLAQALKYGEEKFSKGSSPAEITAKEAYQKYVQDVYDKALEAGKTPIEIADVLSKDKLNKYIEEHKPDENEILKSENALYMTKSFLNSEFDKLAEYDKETKKYNAKGKDVYPAIRYMQYLDGALEQNNISKKEYDEIKQKTAPILLEQIAKMENEKGERTLLGDIYRSVAAVIGSENMSEVMRSEAAFSIAKKLMGAGVDINATAGWWAKTKGAFAGFFGGKRAKQESLAESGGYEVFLPQAIVKQVVGEFINQNVDSTVPQDSRFVVAGNTVVENPMAVDTGKSLMDYFADLEKKEEKEEKKVDLGNFYGNLIGADQKSEKF